MADDYIRREDAVDAAKHAWAKGLEPSQYIESLEPADVAPVVHAHWYILEYESLTCSRCEGFYYTGCDSTAEAEKRLKEGIYPKYCPHCGAKMDGEE